MMEYILFHLNSMAMETSLYSTHRNVQNTHIVPEDLAI